MKVSDKIKPNVDLESLETTLNELDPETYPDYTSDWPKEKLKSAIKEGDQSGDSEVSSLEDYREIFGNNSL